MSSLPASENDYLNEHGGDLARSLGVSQPTWVPLPGGRNNRGFRVDGGDTPLLLKWYFRHPDDPRDRLRTEFDFTRFAAAAAPDFVARALAEDAEHGLAIYEFIEGRAPTAEEIDDRLIDRAIEFCAALDEHRHQAIAQALPPASEACFSLHDHLRRVEARVRRLGEINDESPLHGEVKRLTELTLRPALKRIADDLKVWASLRGVRIDDELPAGQRCLSPSDFGFHNALIDTRGVLKFIDFEYSGWDDPAKLVNDFFCQIERPAPMESRTRFAIAISSSAPRPDLEVERIEQLFSLYRLKWCCIVLNEFVPLGSTRRRFGQREIDLEAQFAIARRLASDAGFGRR